MKKSRSVKIEAPPFFNLFTTCHTHGWKNLPPFKFDCDKLQLYFAVNLSNKAIDVFVHQNNTKIEVTLNSENGINKNQEEYLIRIVFRVLDLGANINGLIKQAEKVGAEFIKLIELGYGRILRAPSLWEDAAKTLFTTNCSWTMTKKVCNKLCSRTFSPQTLNGNFPFPTPQAIGNFSIDQIKEIIPIGYRAKYFISLSKVFSDDPSLNDLDRNSIPFNEALLSVKNLGGFGKYASTHLLMLAGYYDEIPIDSVVTSYLRDNYRTVKPSAFVNRNFKKWGRFKWWGFKFEKILKNQNWIGD